MSLKLLQLLGAAMVFASAMLPNFREKIIAMCAGMAALLCATVLRAWEVRK